MFNIPAIDKDLWLERIRTALSFPVLPTVCRVGGKYAACREEMPAAVDK